MKKLLFEKYYWKFKNTFLYSITSSVYPFINTFEFSKMCEQAGVFKFGKVNKVDFSLAFISTNFHKEKLEGQEVNPEKSLARYEFIELVLRLGNLSF